MYIPVITIEDIVNEKVELLYDFRILRRGKHKEKDIREQNVREMLLACGSEIRMERAIRGIHTGEYNLNQLLTMRGFALQ